MRRAARGRAFVGHRSIASAQVPAGGEFRVNTYTTGRQKFPRAAMEPDGDFVVVWTSQGRIGNGYGVFGQRFAASGAPRGGEFPINTYTTVPAIPRPSPSASRGRFRRGVDSVIRTARTEHPGPALRRRGRRRSARSSWSTASRRAQQIPARRPGADGRFVVIWTSDSRRQLLRASSPAGSTRRAPPSARVPWSTPTRPGFQVSADIAVEAAGNFVVVWEDTNQRDGSGAAIFGQRYDAVGQPLGSEFQVNSYTTGAQGWPAVSVSPAGRLRRRLDSSRRRACTTECSRSASIARERRWGTSSRSTPTPGAISTDCADRDTTPSAISSSRGTASVDAVPWHHGTACAALLRRRAPPWRRVPGQHLHDGVPAAAVGRRPIPSATSSSPGMAYRQDELDLGVFAQRFGGLGPAALAVDTAGQPRAGAGRDGGRAAAVAERQRRRADLQRHADQPHRSRGRRRTRSPTPTGDYGTVAERRDRAVHRLLRGVRVQPAHAAGRCTGTPRGRDHPSRYPGPAEAVAAARRRQLHRRAAPPAASTASSRPCCTTA